jgi:hypothetical protein
VPLDGDPEGRIVAPDFVYDFTAIFAEKWVHGAFRCSVQWASRLMLCPPDEFARMTPDQQRQQISLVRDQQFGIPCRIWVYMGSTSDGTPDLRVKRLELSSYSDEDLQGALSREVTIYTGCEGARG